MTLWCSFQQSVILSGTLTYTVNFSKTVNFSQTVNFSKSVTVTVNFSKTKRRKAILRDKGNSGLLNFGVDEILVSHLTQT